jgi:BASS family bile acid:Na+ symporter
LRDLVIDLLKVIAPLSVALIVFAQALGIEPSRVIAFFRERPGVIVRSLATALLLVPAAALGIILVFDPAPALAVGLAILVACPPAPLMIKSAPKKGGGDAAFMASLHLALAALAIVTVPAVLGVLAIPLEFTAAVDLPSLLWTVAKSMLIPIGLGLLVRASFPAWAGAWAATLDKVGGIGLLVVVVVVLAALYGVLLGMDARSYGVIAAVVVAALALGHTMIGSQHPEKKTILAIECAVRHPGLALAIGSTNFTPQQALPVLVPCIVTSIAIATAYLFWRSRTA